MAVLTSEYGGTTRNTNRVSAKGIVQNHALSRQPFDVLIDRILL